MKMKIKRMKFRNDRNGHVSRDGVIMANFYNIKEQRKERHLFANADTLKLWIASMCGEYGEFRTVGAFYE
jgi:hypothetical protein